MGKKKEEFEWSFFSRPVVGSVFTIMSGLSFLVLAMVLPLVGPAAMRGSGSPGAYRVPWATANIMAFLGILLLSLALAILAIISKMERRKVDNSPLPYWSMGIVVVCVVLLIAFFSGLLAI